MVKGPSVQDGGDFHQVGELLPLKPTDAILVVQATKLQKQLVGAGGERYFVELYCSIVEEACNSTEQRSPGPAQLLLQLGRFHYQKRNGGS